MRDSGFGSFLAGVVIGGLVGAAVGLLLAPQAGDQMREQLGEFVDEKRSQLGDAISEGKAAAARAREQMTGGSDVDETATWPAHDAAATEPA
ncbi:MAG: YtxH domain-containing protein [Candidatus Limnocylindria bacterium]